MPPIFACRGLAVDLPHREGARRILDGIDLEVGRGEFLSVVGASGSGKTTLLRVLGGLVRPSEGTVLYDGVALAAPPEGVVIVFQDYSHALLMWRTVARNVALGLEHLFPRDEIERRVRGALDMVGLSRNARDYPWQLSGGMQQRVQIARALALAPKVLLMDEPFGALDAMTKAALQDELLRLHADTGASFVFITHDIDEAIYLGDRVAILGGRPARIASVVNVALPRPRDQIATRQSRAFLDCRQALHDAFHAQHH
jgi:NitT/TauT family transport system ATP-binding protein